MQEISAKCRALLFDLKKQIQPGHLWLSILTRTRKGILFNKSLHSKYRTSVGGLFYAAVCSRPDISFAVGAIAHHFHAPASFHMQFLKPFMSYLAGTGDLGILDSRSGNRHEGLQALADSEWDE